jgi:hypothetical protein
VSPGYLVSPVASDKYLPIYKAAMDVVVYLEQLAMNETVPGTVSLSHKGTDTACAHQGICPRGRR